MKTAMEKCESFVREQLQPLLEEYERKATTMYQKKKLHIVQEYTMGSCTRCWVLSVQ